jgi:hypothetical protein
MHTTSTASDSGDQANWTLARLQKEIRKHVIRELGKGDGADQILLPIAYAIFLICAFFGKSREVLPASYVFRVHLRSILRRRSNPTSPALVAEARYALDLLRECAIDLGCFDPATWVDRSPAYPSAFDDDDWTLWAPAYLRNPDPQGGAHPWT